MNSYFYLFRFKNSLTSPILYQLKFSPTMICRSAKYTTLSRPVASTSLIKLALPLKSTPHISYRPSSFMTLLKDPKHYNQPTSLWVMERIFVASILVSIPFLTSGYFLKEAEAIFDIFIVMHINWGLDAILRDYLRPAVVGKMIPKFIGVFASLISGAIGFGLLYISLKGKGLLRTIHQLWILETDTSYESKYENFSVKK